MFAGCLCAPGTSRPRPRIRHETPGRGGRTLCLLIGTGERGCDDAEQAPVAIGEVGSVDLSAEHTELVAQDDDLEILRAA